MVGGVTDRWWRAKHIDRCCIPGWDDYDNPLILSPDSSLEVDVGLGPGGLTSLTAGSSVGSPDLHNMGGWKPSTHWKGVRLVEGLRREFWAQKR